MPWGKPVGVKHHERVAWIWLIWQIWKGHHLTSEFKQKHGSQYHWTFQENWHAASKEVIWMSTEGFSREIKLFRMLVTSNRHATAPELTLEWKILPRLPGSTDTSPTENELGNFEGWDQEMMAENQRGIMHSSPRIVGCHHSRTVHRSCFQHVSATAKPRSLQKAMSQSFRWDAQTF